MEITKGPWRVVAATAAGAGTERRDVVSDGTVFHPSYVAGDILEADARLIAAAPEILAALEAALKPLIRLGDFIGNVDQGGASGLGPFDRTEVVRQVNAAIRKAKGE